jgi:tetratricopeptide (TPR) repeat protein
MQRVILCLCGLTASMLSPYLALGEAPPDGSAEQKLIGLVQRAENLCETGRPEEATAVLSEAADLRPDAADVYRVWGCAYDKERQWSKAEEKYKKWAELNSLSYKPFEALGVEAFKQGHYVESNEYFAQAKHLNPYRSHIVDYRCHNFVLLQQWQKAVVECTEAIVLNPKDSYAYGERSTAERATQENDKADKDASAAHEYRGNLADSRFTRFQIFFPVVLAAISVAFLGIGLGVFLRKRPLIFSSRWMLALMLLCFSPQFVMLLSMPDIHDGQHSAEWLLMKVLMPLMFAVLLIFIWLQMQGYMLFGIVDRSFRKALLSVLDELGLERQEELSVIRIPSANLDIQVAIQSWMGVGQLKNKSKIGKEVFQKIIGGLKNRFAHGELETNNTTSMLYVVLGVIMFILCFVLAKL